MAEARTNKKLKSVEGSELYVSTRADIFLIEDEAEWLLGNRDTGTGLEAWLACPVGQGFGCPGALSAEGK